jgi:hypothetical protein
MANRKPVTGVQNKGEWFSSKKSLKPLDSRVPLEYNQAMKALFQTERNDEKPHEATFADRLRHTIAIMLRETEEGIEDWSPTIVRLREVLAEEEGSR